MQLVSEVMTRDVQSVAPGDTVRRAAQGHPRRCNPPPAGIGAGS